MNACIHISAFVSTNLSIYLCIYLSINMYLVLEICLPVVAGNVEGHLGLNDALPNKNFNCTP